MSRRFSDAKIEKLWIVFQRRQSERYVARVCHVAVNSVRKYRHIGKWDSRLKKIKQQVQEKSDNKVVKKRVDDLDIIEAAEKVYVVSMMGVAKAPCPECGAMVSIPVPKLKAKYKDIVAVVDCHQRLKDAGGKDDDKPKKVKYSLAPPEEAKKKI